MLFQVSGWNFPSYTSMSEVQEQAIELQLAYIPCQMYRNTKLFVLTHRLKWKVPKKYPFDAS